MANKTMKPMKPINHAPAKTPSREEISDAMKFLAARREQYALSILSGLGNKRMFSRHAVRVALKRADLLLEKLYPIKEEESK